MLKRCVHIVECFAGGTLEVIRLLANHQVRQGWQVVVLHGQRPDTPSNEQLATLFDPRVTLATCPLSASIHPFRDLNALGYLFHWLRDHPQDVIHLHSSKAGLLGRVAARLLGMQCQVVFTPHSWSFLREDVTVVQRTFFFVLEWLGARLGGLVMACATEEARIASKHLYNAKVRLVRNGLKLPECQSSPSASSLRVITVGRIAPQKAPDRFAALAHALQSTDREFIWVGDGDATLKELLCHHGVIVTGHLAREQVAERVQQSAVFVLLSAWEGLPLALVEAQALGIPAVVSDIPGCREVVEHGVNGFVASSTDQTIALVLQLLEDPELRLSQGLAAQQIASAKFSEERFLGEALSVYDEVLGLSARR